MSLLSLSCRIIGFEFVELTVLRYLFMKSKFLLSMFSLKEEIVARHSLMAISIPISIEQKSLYNAVRYAWRIDVLIRLKGDMFLHTPKD